jgi:osmotically-inducible protein OsmY
LISGTLQGCFPVVAAGVGAGVMMAQDRRPKGAYLEDQRIEVEASDIAYSQFKVLMHVNFTSFNRIVLISGEVPDEATKTAISKIVSGIDKVRRVNNELVVSRPGSLASRSNDTLITSDIKLQYVNNAHFGVDHIKVVTENNTVYLMGIVTRSEGNEAAEIASTSKGVKAVVKMFEYLD